MKMNNLQLYKLLPLKEKVKQFRIFNRQLLSYAMTGEPPLILVFERARKSYGFRML